MNHCPLNEQINQQISQALPGAQVIVTSPDNVHFYAEVTYEGFRDKPIVAQHRLVYAAIKDLLTSETVHALKLDTKTPGASND